MELSLLSHIGKIQERMILRRLDEFAEETNAYGKTQEELMDISVIFPSMTVTHKSGDVSGVTKGSVVIYPKLSSPIRYLAALIKSLS